jgi:hypothetical protein
MIKPETFEQPYVAFGHVPYQCGDDVKHFSPPGGGVLPKGTASMDNAKLHPKGMSPVGDRICRRYRDCLGRSPLACPS